MTSFEVLVECFRYFSSMDESNAAIHCAPVRYSPITFRLAEQLDPSEVLMEVSPYTSQLVLRVREAMGAYEEDKGR